MALDPVMSTTTPGRVIREVALTVGAPPPPRLVDWLAEASGLSRGRIKDAIDKGAVWHGRAGRRPLRLRRATEHLAVGDTLALYYDSQVLATLPPEPVLVANEGRFSVWDKPAGLLVEGSRFGDHATLERLVARSLSRSTWLPHRLDREASGIMLVAHSSQAAAKLGALFMERRIGKRYEVEVLGDVGPVGSTGAIETPLDGKPSRSRYRVIDRLPDGRATRLEIEIDTGRYHQIRRHLEGIGHPVLGDPLYGAGNSDPRGLRLRAVSLSFADPWTDAPRCYVLTGLSDSAPTAQG